MFLILVVFAQSGFWIAVPVSCMSASRTMPVVPVGDTGTIPYSMRQHAVDFVGAAFDTRVGAGDSSRWWYVNTWALSWSRERGEK